jgi:hypothetical protein
LDKDKIDKIKPYLENNGWKLSEVMHVNNQTFREATFSGNGVERKFNITPQEMNTSDEDVETFKAMLGSYKTAHPNKMPIIKTDTPELKQMWVEAFSKVYPEKAQDAVNIIKLKDAPTQNPPTNQNDNTPRRTGP